jgi:hypothetical protein
MKQLPDILTSASFWASIATMWAASGAWLAYVASVMSSRQQTYEGIKNLIHGLQAEFDLISVWACGEEGNKGHVVKTRLELVKENPDWFNPSRMIFKFDTPRLNNVTTSPYIGHLGPVVRQLVALNHSIRQLLDSMERYQAFVMGDVLMYQSVMEKFAPKTSPIEIASAPPPTVITTPHPAQIAWTHAERAYINIIFMMNEGIHQHIIGGADSAEACLYKSFRIARKAVEDFEQGLKRQPLGFEFKIGHFVAILLFCLGFWEVMRWFEVW